MLGIEPDAGTPSPPAGAGRDATDLSLSAPVECVDIELSGRLPGMAPMGGATAGGVSGTDWVAALVRLHGIPVGVAYLRPGRSGLAPAEVARELWRQAGAGIASHLAADGRAGVAELGEVGYPAEGEPACRRRRRKILATAPAATVVVATRERPERLRDCLTSLAALDYPDYEVVVVDNDPATDATRRMVGSEFECAAVRYVVERRRGLAAAHNRGIDEATGRILAFTDDDVVVDPGWLAAIAEGFAVNGRVAAVTGLIRPAELRTPAQVLLEQHGSFGKGFALRVFDLGDNRPEDPLYPLTAGQLGSGANMAFDAEVLRDMGGFDPALGTGTLAHGGDDLMALFSVVAGDRCLVYQPAALVFHHHRQDMDALGRQAFGYGVGLGAYLTAAMIRRPRMAADVARHLPGALRSTLDLASERNRVRYDSWPSSHARLERRGIVLGPPAYLASSWLARRADRPGPRP